MVPKRSSTNVVGEDSTVHARIDLLHRVWHKADITIAANDVRFRVTSWFQNVMSAFDPTWTSSHEKSLESFDLVITLRPVLWLEQALSSTITQCRLPRVVQGVIVFPMGDDTSGVQSTDTAGKQQKVAPIESDPQRIAEKIAEKLSEAGFSCVILDPSGPGAAISTRPKD